MPDTVQYHIGLIISLKLPNNLMKTLRYRDLSSFLNTTQLWSGGSVI